MGFCKFTWKALLILINTIFLSLGWILVGFGIWVQHTNSYLDNTWLLIAHATTAIPKTFIFLGIVTSFIALLGFWGAFGNKKWMLQTYASILLFTLFVQICIGVTAGILVADNDNTKEINAFKMRAEGVRNNDTKVVDFMQWTYECCGYYVPQSMKDENGLYPPSCCGSIVESDICPEPTFTVGCEERYLDLMLKGGFAYIAFAGFQILCIGVAFNLAASIEKKKAVETSPYSRMA